MKKNCFLLFVLLFYSFLYAQEETWFKLSSFNNANSSVWMTSGHNNRNYAITTDRWIYYSDANANSWQPFVNVPSFYTVGSIKASQTTNRVFCLTASSGIAYTDNLGQTWQNNNLNSGGGNSGFGALVLAYGLYNEKVLTSTIGQVSGEIQNKLFLSLNNGNSFSQLANINFYPTGFHFANENTVYSNTANGILKTTNINSGNWVSIGFSGLEVTDLEVNGNTIYTSVLEINGNGNVYKSENGGQSWELLTGIPNNEGVSKLAFDWQNNRLFATSTSGVHVYVNNNWNTVSSINKAHEIITTGNNSVLFSGVRVNGIHKISNTSLSVQQVNQGFMLPADFMVVSEDNQIYTASSRTSFLSKYNLESQNWNAYDLFDDIPSTNILGLIKSPDGQCVIGGMHYIAKTANQGQTITRIATTETAPLAPVYNILYPQKMFVGNNGSIAMMQHQIQTHIDYSPDMGNSWNTLFETVTGIFPGFLSVDKVCAGIQSHFILGLSNQTAQPTIISSVDNGNTWITLPNPSGTVKNIFIDKEDTLYAVTTTTVYRWNATIQNWNALTIDLGQNSSNKVTELAFDNQNRLHILNRSTLTPFDEEGIYLPNDEENGFIQVPFPIINGQRVPMKNLSFAQNHIPIVMTASDGNNPEIGGFYYYYHTPALNITKPNNSKSRLVVYPNPASGELNINENITVSGYFITVTGQKLPVEIINGKINISDLASGIYILNFDFDTKFHQFKVIIRN